MRRVGNGRLSNFVVGVIAIVLVAAGTFFGFSRWNPFANPYELTAVFENTNSLAKRSPVRIAGVDVGKVVDIEPLDDGSGMAKVTMEIKDKGLPIHDDARLKVRPRVFLEGNFFIDLRPGSPSADELPDNGAIPLTRTATAVQLDEVLTALQSDSRTDLKQLLAGYGTALAHEPSAAEDAGQDPDVQGESAAESLNDAFEYGGKAGKSTAIVNEALLGEKPHDLSGLIEAQRDVFTKLQGHEAQLKGLISNFNITAGALAQESSNVSATLAELAPTLEEAEPSLRHTSDALPPLRALARELEPSVRELPGTIEASGPWLDQMKLLLRDKELGGLARLLGQSSKPLAQTSREALQLLPELSHLSQCATDVLEPTGNIVVDDTFNSGATNFQEFFYGAASAAASGGNFDGNGQYLRANAGGGTELVGQANPGGGNPGNTKVYGNALEAPVGMQPAYPASVPPFKPGVLCKSNPVPDVNSAAIAPPDITPQP